MDNHRYHPTVIERLLKPSPGQQAVLKRLFKPSPAHEAVLRRLFAQGDPARTKRGK